MTVECTVEPQSETCVYTVSLEEGNRLYSYHLNRVSSLPQTIQPTTSPRWDTSPHKGHQSTSLVWTSSTASIHYSPQHSTKNILVNCLIIRMPQRQHILACMMKIKLFFSPQIYNNYRLIDRFVLCMVLRGAPPPEISSRGLQQIQL